MGEQGGSGRLSLSFFFSYAAAAMATIVVDTVPVTLTNIGLSLGVERPVAATIENSGTPGVRIDMNPVCLVTFAEIVLSVTITNDTDPEVFDRI